MKRGDDRDVTYLDHCLPGVRVVIMHVICVTLLKRSCPNIVEDIILLDYQLEKSIYVRCAAFPKTAMIDFLEYKYFVF